MPTTVIDTPVAYRPEQAAKAIGISTAKLYELLAAGQIRARKVGRATLILRDDLEQFVRDQPHY